MLIKENNSKEKNQKLNEKLRKYEAHKRDLINYKEKIKQIFKFKTLKTIIKKINGLLDNDEIPEIISDFLKNLLKKIDRAVQYVNDNDIPKTNNLVELFYKVTFPGKIKRIYRTYEGAMNKIRLNNLRWMERNVIGKFTENM